MFKAQYLEVRKESIRTFPKTTANELMYSGSSYVTLNMAEVVQDCG